MTAVRSHLGTALTAVRLLARGDDGWPWRALLAHLERAQRLEVAARALVESWHQTADAQEGSHYREGYGDALHRAADELTAVLDDDTTVLRAVGEAGDV